VASVFLDFLRSKILSFSIEGRGVQLFSAPGRRRLDLGEPSFEANLADAVSNFERQAYWHKTGVALALTHRSHALCRRLAGFSLVIMDHVTASLLCIFGSAFASEATHDHGFVKPIFATM
jgi:hypothetical protein